MFSFPKPSIYQTPKCFVTYGTMGFPDANQLPVKAKPWSTLLSQDFIHKVDLIIPEEVLQLVKEGILDDTARTPQYRRVIMTLGQVLEGDFFTQYIKIGNIIMLSEGKIGVDNVFAIKDGKLTMFLDNESYERVGLVGKLYGVKGTRALQPKWVVEYDLRSQSALHGKKGFDRLIYGCKNALNLPTTWLFYNLSESNCSWSGSDNIPVANTIAPDPSPEPIAQYYPIAYTSNPALVQNLTVGIPQLKVPSVVLEEENRQDMDEYASEVYEWISLVRLESPRVNSGDDIDPFLSTYAVPGNPSEVDEARLCKISWQGFIPPSWAANTLANLIRILPPQAWFSLSTTPITRSAMSRGADCTIMRPPMSAGEYVLWDVKGLD